MSGRPAVFMDRDGTIVEEADYLADPRDLALLPGTAEAIASLNARGVAAVVVTNQSGLARGLFDEAALERVHARLARELAARGARLDLVLVCPHHPDEGEPPLRARCACRKPEPGMILDAAERLGLDLGASALVGDAARDLEAGRRAGVGALYLVATGKGAEARADVRGSADVRHVADLAEAVRDFLGGPQR